MTSPIKLTNWREQFCRGDRDTYFDLDYSDCQIMAAAILEGSIL